ncbi:hypothetical protein DsansV1_C03g0031591 [Dioscorea sansibarensis]
MDTYVNKFLKEVNATNHEDCMICMITYRSKTNDLSSKLFIDDMQKYMTKNTSVETYAFSSKCKYFAT